MTRHPNLSRPFAVVTIFSDGSGVAVRECETRARADMYVEQERARGPGAHGPHEYHLVSLPGLLAWVRVNGGAA